MSDLLVLDRSLLPSPETLPEAARPHYWNLVEQIKHHTKADAAQRALLEPLMRQSFKRLAALSAAERA